MLNFLFSLLIVYYLFNPCNLIRVHISSTFVHKPFGIYDTKDLACLPFLNFESVA